MADSIIINHWRQLQVNKVPITNLRDIVYYHEKSDDNKKQICEILARLDEVELFDELYHDYKLYINEENLIKIIAIHSSYNMANYLINRNVNLNFDNRAIVFAATSSSPKSVQMLKLLVEHGADIHIYNDKPLSVSVSTGRMDNMQFLIENGATIGDDLINSIQFHDSNIEIIKYLVNNGLNLLTDNYGLKIAVSMGATKITKLLLDMGADVNVLGLNELSYVITHIREIQR